MNRLVGLLFLCSSIFIVSCSTRISNERINLLTEAATPVITDTPSSTFTPAANSNLLGYTSTTLEIMRKGERYTVLLGYDIGEAFFRLTPRPEDNMQDDIRAGLQTANLEWYSDLDSDGEIEYLVAVYGRGARPSCSVLAVDYDAQKNEYRIFDSIDGQCVISTDWNDIDNDGNPEIIGRDENFHYLAGGAGADRAFSPIWIMHYDGKKFTSVTKQYPDLIEQDANKWLEAVDNDTWGQGQYQSVYASYLADMYLLGKEDEGVQVFLDLCSKRLEPYIKGQNPEADFSCNELLEQITDAIIKAGF
ncbi:MAG: hypothetical protein QM730_20990 [Anaerolineales bacterium]